MKSCGAGGNILHGKECSKGANAAIENTFEGKEIWAVAESIPIKPRSCEINKKCEECFVKSFLVYILEETSMTSERSEVIHLSEYYFKQ